MYHNTLYNVSVVMRDGMPSLLMTDERIVDFETFANGAAFVPTRDPKREVIDVVLRCPDPDLGWERL